jgi:hypothetical protein
VNLLHSQRPRTTEGGSADTKDDWPRARRSAIVSKRRLLELVTQDQASSQMPTLYSNFADSWIRTQDAAAVTIAYFWNLSPVRRLVRQHQFVERRRHIEAINLRLVTLSTLHQPVNGGLVIVALYDQSALHQLAGIRGCAKTCPHAQKPVHPGTIDGESVSERDRRLCCNDWCLNAFGGPSTRLLGRFRVTLGAVHHVSRWSS